MLSDFPYDMKLHIVTLLPLLVGSDVFTEGVGCDTPNIFKTARKLLKSKPCWKRDLFCFLVTVVSQMVKMPLPPPQWELSLYISACRSCASNEIQLSSIEQSEI